MNIASKIINILILIAAIGAAVCAFLLWQKREQITKGREMLSEAVVQAVDKIGPKGQVQKDQMSIKLEADQLKDPIAVLQKNVDKVCKQRNEIAKAFTDVVNAVNAVASTQKKENLDVNDVIDYMKSADKRTEGTALVDERVKYIAERNAALKSGLREIASALQLAAISETDFPNNAKVKANFREQAKRAADYAARFNKYAEHIIVCTNKLQSAVDDIKLKTPSLGLQSTSWQSDLAANREGISKLAAKIADFRQAVEKMKQENETMKQRIAELESDLKKKDEEIASLQKKLKEKESYIRKLTGDDDGTDSQGSKTLDVKMLKRLVGKIVDVDPKYGFVTINLGAKTVLERKVGTQVIKNNVALPDDAIMTVATSLDPGEARYVARVCVAKIGATHCIANVLPIVGSEKPKVGDVVFFSEADFAQMRMIREQAAKKAEEASAKKNAKAAEETINAGEESEGKDKKEAEKDDSDDDEKDDSSSSDDSESKDDQE